MVRLTRFFILMNPREKNPTWIKFSAGFMTFKDHAVWAAAKNLFYANIPPWFFAAYAFWE